MSAAAISAEARKAGVRTPKLPDMPPTEDENAPSAPAPKPKSPPTEEDDFIALAKRFEALKKR